MEAQTKTIKCAVCGRESVAAFVDDKPICNDCNGTLCVYCCVEQRMFAGKQITQGLGVKCSGVSE